MAKSTPEMILLALLIDKKVCTFEDYEGMTRRLAEQFIYTLDKVRSAPTLDEKAVEDVIEADLRSFLTNLSR